LRKLILISILFCFVQLCQSQTRPDEVIISYSAYNKPLRIVLKDLSNISKVSLIYSESRLPSENLINISAQNEKLGSVLTVILDDFGFTYQIVGNQLVVVKNESKYNKGQSRIYGYVRDKISGELLIGANVFLHDKSGGTVTNEDGFFSFPVKKQEHRIHFSYLGYQSEIRNYFILKDTMVNISLQPDGLLNEIIIMDNLLEEEHEQTSSQQNLHIDKIRSSNHLGGEADLFRYMTTQPGVSTAAEGIGGLNVRGGSADQNLVLLDGVPVYNIGHAMGIFSIFNANSIKNVSFYKGGIPSRYAGRLSSVIDVHTKDGNNHKLSGDATLSTIAFKGTLEGPLLKDKGSFLVSYRRTFMDVWIKEFTKFQNREKDRNGAANYYFNDLNTKLNFRLSDKTRLLLQTLHSNDDFNSFSGAKDGELRNENSSDLTWGNQLYSLRLHSQLGKALFSKTTLYKTGYKFESFRNKNYETLLSKDTTVLLDASLYESEINEIGLKQEFDWLISPDHTVKTGFNFQKREFSPRVVVVTENDIDAKNTNVNATLLKDINDKQVITGDEINVYAEDLMSLGDGVNVNLGLNYSYMKVSNDKNYALLQPRIALLAGGDHLHFKIGASRMVQYMHLLTNNGLGFPSDVWLPVSDVIAPQKSWIFNTSFGYRLNSGLKFGMEVYFKTLEEISTFKEGGVLDISSGNDWESQIPIGEGYAYGLESYVEKVVGKTLFSLNYTYSVSDRRFADLNNGLKFPFGLNRDHSLKFSLTYRLSQFSEFLLNWSYMSGNYYSQPINSTFELNGKPIVIFPQKNNTTFPAFHRLDVGFSFYNVYKWGRAKFFLGLYNAYNRNNPFYTELERNKETDGKFEFRQLSLLPMLPTVSYSISF